MGIATMRNRTSASGVGVTATGALLLWTALLPGRIYADANVQPTSDRLTTKHRVADIVNHPAFKGFGELLMPWDDNGKYYDTRLDQVGRAQHGAMVAAVPTILRCPEKPEPS